MNNKSEMTMQVRGGEGSEGLVERSDDCILYYYPGAITNNLLLVASLLPRFTRASTSGVARPPHGQRGAEL